MFAAVALACSLLLASSSGKTVETLGDPSASTSSPETSSLATVADQVTALLRGVLKGVGGDTAERYGSLLLPTLLRQLPPAEGLRTMLTDGLGVHEDFLKVFPKIVDGLNNLEAFSPKALGAGTTFLSGNDIVSNEYDNGDDVLGNSTTGETNVNSQYLNLVKHVFQEEFGGFPRLPLVSEGPGDTPDSQGGLGMTTSSMWMLIKSTWQRVLAYVEDENALPYFMQLTPVRIIDRLLDLGDDLNLMNFLAQKLDKDFAEFIAEEVTPDLGPLKDFDSFYNFTRENGFSGILDYFRSKNFGYTMTAMSRFISAYFDDSFSDDVADQYIAFISFDNTDLYNFYKSLLQTQRRTVDDDDSGRGRFKRENLNKMIGDYKFTGYDFQPETPAVDAGRELSRDGGYGGHSGGYGGGHGHGGGGGGGHGGGGGGHGGGGYGYGSGYGGGYGHGGGGYEGTMIDPAVVLSSVAIGALLGFLLFRLIRGTGNGRRDIGDGSLSLWLSDVPDKALPWGTSVDRTKRHVQKFNATGGDEFNLPDSLRGDVWSTDPLVGDNLLDDEFEEDDIADRLNQLWRVYKRSNEAACVQSHLCGVMTNSTAEHLTGKDSSLPLIMASVGNLMGVAGPGQLVDEVVQTMVVGNQYTCPSLSQCHLLL